MTLLGTASAMLLSALATASGAAPAGAPGAAPVAAPAPAASAFGHDDTSSDFWMPPQASTIAADVDWVFFAIYWVCVFFFVLIVALMVYFAIKWQRPRGVPAEKAPTHNTPLELSWTILPLIIVIVMFYVGLDGYVDLTQAPANSYEVRVTAQKWSWTFDHRSGCTEAGVLTVPANRPVRLVMGSQDVLHALFIPSFRVKQDIVPGRYTDLWFEARPGTYQLFCAEYCGTEHSQMTGMVRVLPEEEFELAMDECANFIKLYGDAELFKAGPRLAARCSSCHSLDGSTKQGPSWVETHSLWGKKRVLADGREVVVDENYIRKSILDPHADLVATFGKVMPTFKGQLRDREIDALIDFVKHLDEVIDEKGKVKIDLKPTASEGPAGAAAPAAAPAPGAAPNQ